MSIASLVSNLSVALTEANLIANPPPPSNSIVTFGVLFDTTGLRPWAYGHTFKRGAIPSGMTLVADCAQFQFNPVSYYDDGSVRWGRIAGYCQVASAGRVNIKLSVAPFVLTTTITRSLPNYEVFDGGVLVSVTKRTTVATGNVMVHERWEHAIDSTVRFVVETRSFANGEAEVFAPCIENAGFTTTSQPNRVLNLRVVIGSVIRFNETVDVKHHTRIPLVRGSTWSYWLGTTQQLQPIHDGAYLCTSESLPPFAQAPWSLIAPLFAAKHPVGHPLAGQFILKRDYYPNYIGESGSDMAGTGYRPSLGVVARHSIYYLTTGAKDAWDYMMAESLSAGSWSMHLRDELTGESPLIASYPTRTLQSNIPTGSGAVNGTADRAHQPSFVYVAALCSGWQWFVDEHLHWVIHNHFYQQPPVRFNEKGILRTDAGTNQDRGAAWTLRSLAQAVALVPATSPHAPQLATVWAENMAFYQARLSAPPYANNLGIIAPYSSYGTSLYTGGDRGTSTAWWGAGWMQPFITAALGHAIQLKLPITAQAKSDTDFVFQFSAKWIVGLTGPTHWRRFGVYAAPWWPDGQQFTPGTWYTDFAQMWQEYESAKGLTTLDPAPGGTIKQHSTNVDITGADWQTGRVSFFWPALVYAVMHNAPGAQEGFDRIRSSASYPLIAAGVQNPIWTGMMPPGVKHPGSP